jgi:hypothetical protein
MAMIGHNHETSDLVTLFMKTQNRIVKTLGIRRLSKPASTMTGIHPFFRLCGNRSWRTLASWIHLVEADVVLPILVAWMSVRAFLPWVERRLSRMWQSRWRRLVANAGGFGNRRSVVVADQTRGTQGVGQGSTTRLEFLLCMRCAQRSWLLRFNACFRRAVAKPRVARPCANRL